MSFTAPRIPGYEIKKEIGRGGMGVVFLARHLRHKRDVALKVLGPALSADPIFRERFTRESNIAMSLAHPNIVPVYEADEFEGLLYIAMQYVVGQDLGSRIKAGGPLDLPSAVEVVKQIAGALDHAHSRGLVHRDVKPSNIFLADLTGRPDVHCFLADFGLARHRTSETLTRTGEIVGTLNYMSPEQIEGRTVDGRADLYGLACVFYEMLTGFPPYEADSDGAILWSHINKRPPSIHPRAKVPPQVDWASTKALAKDPRRRFVNCGEFAQALDTANIRSDRALGDPYRRVANAARGRRVVRQASRKPGHKSRWPWLALAAVLVVAGAVAIALSVSDRNRPQSPSEGGQGTNEAIVLPTAGDVETSVMRRNPRATLPATYGLAAPRAIEVCGPCKVGDSLDLGEFAADTRLLLYMRDTTGRCLSSDTNHALIEHPQPTEWIIRWNDQCGSPGDTNYTDLVTRVSLRR